MTGISGLQQSRCGYASFKIALSQELEEIIGHPAFRNMELAEKIHQRGYHSVETGGECAGQPL